MKHARDFLKTFWGYDVADLKEYPSNSKINAEDYKAVKNSRFYAEIESNQIDFSVDVEDRFFRCHSQAAVDFYILKFKKFERIPDIVIWPKCHKDVETVVKAANIHNVVIIPVGGLTNVTCANNCPEHETRMIVSLDMTQMNRMLWLNESSMLACFETGIAGQDLERVLETRGFTMGHEPDSIEFSTLGGWIATRSSGIKQQTYGNIEDIVLSTKTVTSIGVLDKSFIAPRVSMGPELEHCILGSEGTLGVITEAIVQIHKLPEVRKFGGIILPNFATGIRFLHECSQNDWLPSSLRLYDNTHTQYGAALSANSSLFSELYEQIGKKVLTNRFMLGYEEDSYVMASYLFEGDKKSVNEKEAKFLAVANKYKGFNRTLETFGKRAYNFTPFVAYARVSFTSDCIRNAEVLNSCEK
jgi:alkyldihydroxyacetonephosphate synthase